MKEIKNTKEFCRYDWGDIFIQGGNCGLVIDSKDNSKSYTTAFVEAFPKSPRCFIRGEGNTIQEAEEQAWNRYQNILNCKGHEFEARGRTDGYGFCKNCNLSQSEVLPIQQWCCVCDKETNFTRVNEKFYCGKHANNIPKSEYKKERENSGLSLSLGKLLSWGNDIYKVPRKLKKAMKKAFNNSLVKNGFRNDKIVRSKYGTIKTLNKSGDNWNMNPFGSKKRLINKYGKNWL